jgi:hypothetical protein
MSRTAPKATRDTSIPIGSFIRITDTGQVYTHFQEMANHMGMTRFEDGSDLLANAHDTLAQVVGKGVHYRESDGELLGVELQDGRQGLIGIKGVTLISLPKTNEPTVQELLTELAATKAKLWEAEWKLRKITEVAAAGIL